MAWTETLILCAVLAFGPPLPFAIGYLHVRRKDRRLERRMRRRFTRINLELKEALRGL